MQKFFIHFQGQQLGPFSLEELKQKGITRNTMVWFDGLPEWKEAKDVYELADLFRNQPPPFTPPVNNPPPYEHSAASGAGKTPAGKNTNIIVIAVLLLTALTFVGATGYSYYRNEKAKELKMRSKISRQQETIKLQEQERIAEEERRAALVRKAQINRLRQQLDNALTKLRLAKIRLDEVQEFQFLRTYDEKQSQINEQLSVIRSWENEVSRIQQQLAQY